MLSFSKRKKNLVVGCGFAGAVLAERLSNISNEDVLIIDKKSHPGGLAFDYQDKNGITVQKFGSHVFHTNYEYIWKYLNKFGKITPLVHKEKVFVEGMEVPYPFNLNTLYQVFPKNLASKLENKLISKYGYDNTISIFDIKTKPFFWDRDLDFLANYFYQHLFIHYVNKKWDNKNFNNKNALININKDDRIYKDKYQGTPEKGYTKLIENILNHKNIKILFDVDFKNIDTTGFDRIFYTGSIDEFFDYKFGPLQYRSATFEISATKENFSANVIRYPNNYDFLKIHRFKDTQNQENDKSVILKEYVSDFKPNSDTERFYPVLNKKNIELYKQYKIEAKKFKDVYFLGRLGDFKNYSIDKVIKRSLEIFEAVRLKSLIEENNSLEHEYLTLK